MTELPKQQQHKQSRRGRLSAALRDNLKRRKAQTKGRAEPLHGPATHDSARISTDKRND